MEEQAILELLQFLMKNPELTKQLQGAVSGGSANATTTTTSGGVSPEAYSDAVNKFLAADPKKIAIETAVRAISNGVRAGGQMAENNGNRLAAAILARSRAGTSDAQRSLYGPSVRETSAEAWAQNRMRKGENARIATNAVSNTIDAALGDYKAQDMMARQRQMVPYDLALGGPGNYWQSEGAREHRAQRMYNDMLGD